MRAHQTKRFSTFEIKKGKQVIKFFVIHKFPKDPDIVRTIYEDALAYFHLDYTLFSGKGYII